MSNPQTASTENTIAAELAAGLAHYHARRIADAEQHYRRALQLRPDHAEANNLMGLALLARGDFRSASEHFERAIAAAPKNSQYHGNLGVALNAGGAPDRALQALARALELKPDYAEAHSNAGMVLRRLNRPREAAEHYRKAIALRPNEPGFHANLGHVMVGLGESEDAEREYRHALKLRPDHVPTLSALSNLLDEMGRSAEAAAIAERVLEAAPRTSDPAFHRSRGKAYRLAGKLDMAEASFRKSLELNPRDVEAWSALSQIRDHHEPDADLARLLKLREDPALGEEDRISLDLSLGRWFDDLGDDARSYEHYARANDAIRPTLGYTTGAEEVDYEKFRSLFDPVPDLPATRPDAFGPVFIVGEPRSGKSTLEGMLSAHPRLKAAGELYALDVLVTKLFATHGLGEPGAHINRVPTAAWDALGKAYLDVVRLLVPQGLIPIDTMPLNYRYVGIIRMALPNARIIHMRRDRVDHAIGLYQKRFPGRGYPYTYAFEDLGHHFGLYDRLMAFWNEAFPGFVHEVDASRLDETNVRELLAFLGIEWIPACLDYHESEPRLGGDSARRARRREEVRRFYEPLLRPYLPVSGPGRGS